MERYRIDSRSRIPLVHQVSAQIRTHIARGEYEVGDFLPSVRDLGEKLKVNFNTVAKAYRLLEREGLLEIRHGLGVRVKDIQVEETYARSRRDLLNDLEDIICHLTLSGSEQEEVVDIFAEAIGRHYGQG